MFRMKRLYLLILIYLFFPFVTSSYQVIIWDALRDLVQFKKREKHLKTYCFFSSFSNCTNSTKLRKASYIKIYKINHAIFLCLKKMPSGFFETTYNFWKSCNAKLHKIFLCQTVWELFQSWCIVFMIYPLIKTDAKTTRHQKV